MTLFFPSVVWAGISQAGIILLTAFLGWVTYRSHLILKSYRLDFNLLLSPPEQAVRLLLVGICLFLAWLSGLPAAQFGFIIKTPWQTLGLGVGAGLATLLLVNLLTGWAINRFGRDIYSPLIIKNILPRRPVEWPLTAVALAPAVVMEELLFRSLWLGAFGDVVSRPLLILGTSVLFGLMHLPQGWLGVILAGAINILLSLLFVWSGQLLTPLAAHYLVNLLQLVVAHRRREWLENY